MAAKEERPYLKRPIEYAYWKKARVPHGAGVEVMNYASPHARALWYYLRSMGHVKHPAGWKHEHHGEDGFVLHVVHRGELWHLIKGRRYVARPGEACLLDLRHDVTYGAGVGTSQFYWAWLNGRDMPRVFLDLGADQDPVFALPDLRRVESLLRELRELTLREPKAYEVRSSGLLTMILAELFAARADTPTWISEGQAGRPLSEPVRRGIDYITRNYDQNISVKHIALAVAERSLNYFSRRFHQEVGMSPVAYLNRFRIEQAKKFLAGGNQSVAQIARSVGFPDPDHFTRMFARAVGVTPRAYRRKPQSARRNRSGTGPRA